MKKPKKKSDVVENVMTVRNVDVFYGSNHAVKDVSLDIRKNQITALIGPSGCGKSTLLRCLNRMNDNIEICKITGEVKYDGQDIYDKNVDVVALRARIGMVFQKPNPFPKSIYDNVAYGPRIHRLAENKQQLDDIVENSLKKPVCLLKLQIGWRTPVLVCRAANNKDCALHGRLRWSQR